MIEATVSFDLKVVTPRSLWVAAQQAVAVPELCASLVLARELGHMVVAGGATALWSGSRPRI